MAQDIPVGVFPQQFNHPVLKTAETAAYLHPAQVRQSDDEARKLEQRASDQVNQACGLTPADINLMWRTAPPRMPLKASSATVLSLDDA